MWFKKKIITDVNYEVTKQLVSAALAGEFEVLKKEKAELERQRIILGNRAEELSRVSSLEIRSQAEIARKQAELIDELAAAQRKETDNPPFWKDKQKECELQLELLGWLIKK